MIEERSITVAVCDACGHKDYANDQGEFIEGGYALTIVDHCNGTRHEAYACRVTHIGKAARAALLRGRDDDNSEDPSYFAEGGTMPPDAPPLPEYNGDATAVNP